jgi:hypothetical protein
VFSAVDRSVLGVEAVAPLRSPFDPAGLLDALGVVRARALAAFTLAATAPPTITGVPAVGQTLTLDEGAWTGAPSTFTYVWLRCDQSSTCTPIAGATKRSYTVTAADSGYALRVAVTGANAVSSLKSTSAPTATVQ